MLIGAVWVVGNEVGGVDEGEEDVVETGMKGRLNPIGCARPFPLLLNPLLLLKGFRSGIGLGGVDMKCGGELEEAVPERRAVWTTRCSSSSSSMSIASSSSSSSSSSSISPTMG